MRAQVNNYFRKILPKNPKTKEEREFHTIQQFPQLIDYCIKEQRGSWEAARKISPLKVALSQRLYLN
jgi:hypothetical protein